MQMIKVGILNDAGRDKVIHNRVENMITVSFFYVGVFSRTAFYEQFLSESFDVKSSKNTWCFTCFPKIKL